MTTRYVVINPANGLHVRKATETEVTAYLAQAVRSPAFRKPVLVDSVLVDAYQGPGLWFGGAGF